MEIGKEEEEARRLRPLTVPVPPKQVPQRDPEPLPEPVRTPEPEKVPA
jgi:hypothetical protein